jgi:DNA primase small subunit
VILQYTYPRIDTEVSKHLNHLLKSPFCIHPGTGRVCTPFASLKEIEDFDPEEVPTVGQLLRELERNPADGYRGTSLKKYVDIFDKHCEGIVRANLLRKKGGLLFVCCLRGLMLLRQSQTSNRWSSEAFQG